MLNHEKVQIGWGSQLDFSDDKDKSSETGHWQDCKEVNKSIFVCLHQQFVEVPCKQFNLDALEMVFFCIQTTMKGHIKGDIQYKIDMEIVEVVEALEPECEALTPVCENFYTNKSKSKSETITD